MRSPEICEADWALLLSLKDAIASRFDAEAGVGPERRRPAEWERSACMGSWTRGTAVSKIALLWSRDLIRAEEFSRFSEATRKAVQFLVNPL